AFNNASYFCVGLAPGDHGVLRVRDQARLWVGGDFNVSDQSGSTGTVELEGGLVRGNVVYVGKAGGTQGTVHHSGGELRSRNWFNVGSHAGSTGDYELTGGQITAGTDLNVSDTPNSTGTLDLVGGKATAFHHYVGKAGGTSGTVNHTGGLSAINERVILASAGGSTGSYTLDQDGTLVAHTVAQGAGSGQFHFQGGTLNAQVVDFSLANQGGVLEIGAPSTPGTLKAEWHAGTEFADNAPSATRYVGRVYGNRFPDGWTGGGDHFSVRYSGELYAPADGTYAFRESNDDGAVLLLDGAEVLHDTIYNPGGPAWTRHTSNSVFLTEGWHSLEFLASDDVGGQWRQLEWDPSGGSNWTADFGPYIRALPQAGTTRINGGYSQGPEGTLAVDLMGLDRGTGYDWLDVADDALLEGTLDVLVDEVFEQRLTAGNIFDVVEAATVTVDGLTIADNVDWGYFAYSIVGAPGGRQALRLEFIPEPTTVALLGLGGLALLRRRRRTR
ncbi:MAG: PA14 domain-containing protein, partial [Planctomycetota bacterium]